MGKLIPSFAHAGSHLRRTDLKEFKGSRVDFDSMLDEYYRLRQLNERGYPDKKLLKKLGLEEVSDVLYAQDRSASGTPGVIPASPRYTADNSSTPLEGQDRYGG